MNRVIHLLGANIPHHNQTVLRFFSQAIHSIMPARTPRQFWVVTDDREIAERYPHLEILVFASKRALAAAVIAAARQRETRFFCHGQFNARLWLALLTGEITRSQFYWHVWGADLYEDSSRITFRLFYLLRRQAQKRVAAAFATRGDINHLHQRYPALPASLLYFPTRLAADVLPSRPHDGRPNILLGNSGDASNRHIAGLQDIHRHFGNDVNVIVPLGYPENNQAYIAQVRTAANALFLPGRVELLTEKVAFSDYLAMLARCDLGWFTFRRQQGIGTLCLLIQANVPFVLDRRNPFWQDLAEQQVPVLFTDDQLDINIVAEARRKMSLVNKQQIAFFEPGYLAGWQQALQQVEGEDA